MNKLVSTLHDATHLVPGVPAHGDAPTVQRPHRTRVSPRPHNRSPRRHSSVRHQTPPRVLITWQNRIARLFGHKNHHR